MDQRILVATDGSVLSDSAIEQAAVSDAAIVKHRCDLIVLASHGPKGMKRILLGSQTRHVLTHSKLLVLR